MGSRDGEVQRTGRSPRLCGSDSHTRPVLGLVVGALGNSTFMSRGTEAPGGRTWVRGRDSRRGRPRACGRSGRPGSPPSGGSRAASSGGHVPSPGGTCWGKRLLLSGGSAWRLQPRLPTGPVASPITYPCVRRGRDLPASWSLNSPLISYLFTRGRPTSSGKRGRFVCYSNTRSGGHGSPGHGAGPAPPTRLGPVSWKREPHRRFPRKQSDSSSQIRFKTRGKGTNKTGNHGAPQGAERPSLVW